jgi:hypothetical protein
VREPVAFPQAEVVLNAAIDGRLRIDADCVRFEARDGQLKTPVFADGTRIGRDARGVYVRDGANGHTLRNGDRFHAGGGALTAKIIGTVRPATGPVPRVCLGEFYSLNAGVVRA